MSACPVDSSRLPKYRRCKEERPGQLLEAARIIFCERGFAAARLADVAAHAGVSPGTVCAYFPTKEALFLAVVKHQLGPHLDNQQAIAEGPGSPRERLIDLLRAKAVSLGEPGMSALAKLVMSEIGSFPEIGREFWEAIAEPWMRQISLLIEEGMACGEFRRVDPRVQSRLLVDPLVFDAISRISLGAYDPHPIDRQTMVEAHLFAALRGLDRRPAPDPYPPCPEQP